MHAAMQVFTSLAHRHAHDLGTGAYRHTPQHVPSSWDMSVFIFLLFLLFFHFFALFFPTLFQLPAFWTVRDHDILSSCPPVRASKF